MALQICTECKTAYAPAGVCPNCGANHWVDETTAEERGWYSTNGDSVADVAEPVAPETDPADGGGTTPDVTGDGSADPSHTDAVDHAEVRAWAQEQGLQVADSGPVPQWVIDQFNEQHK